MTEQEKRELDEYIAREIMGWERITIQGEKRCVIKSSDGDQVCLFTDSHDSISLLEQKIAEAGLKDEYIAALWKEVFSIEYKEEHVLCISFNSIFQVKTATSLQCAIAARKAWENKKGE